MNGPELITFGCRLNAYESEAIRARATEAGLTDAVIVNTCAVTGEAVRQSRQAIRRAARANPSARIVVTGCAAQIEPEMFSAMPEVDLVLGNREKLETASYAGLGLDTSERVRVNDIMSVKETAAQPATKAPSRSTTGASPELPQPIRSAPASPALDRAGKTAASGP